ncbi:MAG: TIGR02147 family protein [Deltaproteobacteria bacterium]|nr:TIGR02147 family protein [Deltaproteobacteria bacterium]
MKELFAFKKQESATFSFRNFSRLAGLKSSNFLKLVMDGKRNLSPQSIHQVAKAFKLPKGEADFFETLVFFNQAQNMEEKKNYYERIQKFQRYKEAKPLDASQYVYFSNWYFVALRELVLLMDFKEDPRWINKKLGTRINPDEIKRAIRILLEIKLLTRDKQGRLQQCEEKISTSPEMGALAIINYHREMIAKASASIEESKTVHRDLSALTVAISKEQYDKIRRKMDELREEIHELSTQSSARQAIYQINFQIFNLTEVPW